jgi:hypothetical protein
MATEWDNVGDADPIQDLLDFQRMILGEMKDRNIGEKLRRDREFLQKKNRQGQPSMKTLYYAGIGSRRTPEYIMNLMEQLANKLREDEFVLRTGHAPGADQAFEKGAGGQAQIFLPWSSFQQDCEFTASRNDSGKVVYPTIFNAPSLAAAEIAAQFHPAWDSLTQGARKLHARNVHQILGPQPDARPTPVEFVLCWTPNAEIVGGTAQAIRIAEGYDISVHNLADEDVYDVAFEWAWGGE